MHVARMGQERNAYKFRCKREKKTLLGDKSRNGGVILALWPWNWTFTV